MRRGIGPEGEEHVAENRALKQAIRRRMAQTGEKYTEARRAVLGRAPREEPEQVRKMRLCLQEADSLGHNYIGCEHLLLGILADEEDPAAKVLVAHGVTLALARRRTAEIVGDGPQDSQRGTFSPRATVVRKLAEVEAERLGQLAPRHGHALLAMITEGGGVPMALFNEFEVDVGKLREDLLSALDAPDDVRQIYLGQRIASERAGDAKRID